MKLKSIIFLGILLLTTISTALEANNRNNNSFPVGRLVLTPEFYSPNVGLSLLGEGGPWSYRGNGTLGGVFSDCMRFKAGGEFLGMDTFYNFGCPKKTERWVQQWAAGGEFQQLICHCWLESIEIGGAYSQAHSKNLRSISINNSIFDRRISGSNYWDAYAGATLTLWCNGKFYFDVVYDHILYKRCFSCRDKHVKGIGADIGIIQTYCRDIDVSIHGSIREPYRSIGGRIDWNNAGYWSGFGLALFGDYVQGRHGLPNETTFGFEFAYTFGFDCGRPIPFQTTTPTCGIVQQATCGGLTKNSWISSPAVYRPTVFAITEHRFR